MIASGLFSRRKAYNRRIVQTRLGRYEIQGVLGRGGMGVVYRAVDTHIGRDVAVKTILLSENVEVPKVAELRERLFREMRAAGALQHPNIVMVHD
jgi:serine/threonine protein kinase